MPVNIKSVWVIEQGSYSDYHVVGVFTTKENAELVSGKIKSGYGDEPTIAEWQLDPNVAELRKRYKPFSVVMLRDGTVERCDQRDFSSYALETTAVIWRRTKAPAFIGKNIPDALDAKVLARDEKHAIKIVNEKRAQMIADGEWK